MYTYIAQPQRTQAIGIPLRFCMVKYSTYMFCSMCMYMAAYVECKSISMCVCTLTCMFLFKSTFIHICACICRGYIYIQDVHVAMYMLKIICMYLHFKNRYPCTQMQIIFLSQPCMHVLYMYLRVRVDTYIHTCSHACVFGLNLEICSQACVYVFIGV